MYWTEDVVEKRVLCCGLWFVRVGSDADLLPGPQRITQPRKGRGTRCAEQGIYIYTCFKFSSLSQVAERLDGIGIWDLMGWIFGLWIVLQGRAKAARHGTHEIASEYTYP